jgi:hypothetical protein
MRQCPASILVLVALALNGCGSEGGTQSDAEDITSGGVKFADFQKEMAGPRDALSSDTCFSVESASEGLTLTATEGSQKVTVQVAPNAKISLKSKKTAADGSFTKVFALTSGTTVTVVHADDAFDSVRLSTTSPKSSATCEVDF